MFTISRRTVTTLAFFGLFAMLGISVPGPAAADDKDIAQALQGASQGFRRLPP